MTETLRESITSHLNELAPPPGDLSAVTVKGRRVRLRRNGRKALALAAGVVAIGFVATQLAGGGAKPKHYPSVAAFNVAHGLRAYASPDTNGMIHLGDHSYPAKGLGYLDTDATATPYGVLFFAHDQTPRLLADDGQVVRLGAGPTSPTRNFEPSSTMEAASPLVAWTENDGGSAEVVIFDLQRSAVVATRAVPCDGAACDTVKVDGLDHGVAFVRTSAGTFMWRHSENSWTQLGGPKLRVADVRNRTILYSGTAPTLALNSWRYVKGAVDAELTFDGANVLDWSNTLKPTSPGGHTITLGVGGKGELAFFTFDTDGSVLVAVDKNPSNPDVPSDVFDCDIPSGHCTKIGMLPTRSGDPIFIGNDM
jgi:hypothetical protein